MKGRSVRFVRSLMAESDASCERSRTNAAPARIMAMSVVRVSILNIPVEQLEQASQRMREAERSLVEIRRLPGLLAYFVGVDRSTSQLSNVSVWDTDEHARAMSTFQPMLDLARTFSEIPGVTFVRPIPNFEGLWQWGDASGGGAPDTTQD